MIWFDDEFHVVAEVASNVNSQHVGLILYVVDQFTEQIDFSLPEQNDLETAQSLSVVDLMRLSRLAHIRN